MASTYHRILGIAENADAAAIKAAFRRLAHRYHPDISKDPDAAEKFVAVVDAYRALISDKKKGDKKNGARKSRSQRAWVTPVATAASSFSAFNADSASAKKAESAAATEASNQPSQFEAKPPHSRPPEAKPGPDCHIVAPVSIEELYWGVELKVDAEAKCPSRRTKKKSDSKLLLKVKIEPGTRDGTRLRLRGKGGAGSNGGPNGDLYLTLAMTPHQRYQARDADLYVDMPLSPWEAQQGAVVDVTTPAGRLEVDVPAGIRAGQSIRINGRGLPRSKSIFGDLYAVARLVSVDERAKPNHKWPHLSHPNMQRWRPIVGSSKGNRIDVRA